MTDREQRIWDAVYAGYLVKHDLGHARTRTVEGMIAADEAVEYLRAELAHREAAAELDLEEKTRPNGDARKKR